MNQNYVSADVILCDTDGHKTLVSLEPGQLEVIVRVMFGDKFESETYSTELEAQDPYFDRKMQAELCRRATNMEKGNYVVRDLIVCDKV